MKVFVLFYPATYEGECGNVYGVFSSKKEAEKHKGESSSLEIQEHTLDEYDGNVKFYY
ncbi:hypothetical protein [Listeria booriae]|uniref:hypothetical protein n=1 Tax=Listeria booriae TaxID=1552123 RepID=UPI00162534E6|nr:hypothetical protein [Listeria booriae]MBC2196825.1 hypothetical protein [Listeria booriae]